MIRKFQSLNPATGKLLQEFPFISNSELNQTIQNLHNQYQSYSKLSLKNKQQRLLTLAELIEKNTIKYAEIVTSEMGKPINDSILEVQKAAGHCRYFSTNAEKYLKSERVKTEAKESYIQYSPIGVIYQIAPFNFPFWLAFKSMIPSILLGNTYLMRPSDSTPLVGLAIQDLMHQAGFHQHEFQNVFTSQNQLEQIISQQAIQGVTFTGSTKAASIIAQKAGQYLKRNVMELGGSDPFLVFKDADIDLAVELAVKSRVANCGQVCFSAKRFIIDENQYENFKVKLVEKLKNIKIGDPTQKSTQMGPLARLDLLEKVEKQVFDSLNQKGASLLYGGERVKVQGLDGYFYKPTVIQIEDKKNSIWNEEVFGPVFPILKAKNENEMIEIANETQYGLGAVLVLNDSNQEKKEYINSLNCGMVFVNQIVKSDSRLPSGGVKASGYGRECSRFGVESFANIKTVWIQ